MTYDVLLDPLPPTWDKLESMMLVIFYQLSIIFRFVAIDNILLPQLLVLVYGHFLQKLQLFLWLLSVGFRHVLVECPYDKGQGLFSFIEDSQFVGMFPILNLDVAIEIFLKSIFHLSWLFIFQLCRQSHTDHIARFEFNIFWKYSIATCITNIRGLFTIVLLLKQAWLRINGFDEFIDMFLCSWCDHIWFFLWILPICNVEDVDLSKFTQNLLSIS